MVLVELARAIHESPDLDALERAVRACLATTRPAAFVEAMAVSIAHLERGGFHERADDLAVLFALLRPDVAEKRTKEERRARTAIGATAPNFQPTTDDSRKPRGLTAGDLRAATRMRLR